VCRQQEFSLELRDGNNEDLIKKNKKRKPLGIVHFKICLTPMTKEEMNEVVFSLNLFYLLLYANDIFAGNGDGN
jgi:hypothetical protein